MKEMLNLLTPRFSRFLTKYGNVGLIEDIGLVSKVKSTTNQKFKLIEETNEYMAEITRFVISDRPQEDLKRIEEFGDMFFILLQMYYNSKDTGLSLLISGLTKVDYLLSVEPDYKREYLHDINVISDDLIYNIIVNKMHKFKRKHVYNK